MIKYVILIIIAVTFSSCSVEKEPIYNDSEIRWAEEEIIEAEPEMEAIPAQKNITNIPVNTEAVSGKVYVTESGKKYHYDGCQFLSKSKIEKDYNEAVGAGYTPCDVCNTN